MMQIMDEAFDEDEYSPPIAGYCVAGGSTKGNIPTAMEDDTQNGVRQGIRDYSQERWENYECCFWEMGAKLMLQPQVGKLWGLNTESGQNAARELFYINSIDMSNEIITKLDM